MLSPLATSHRYSKVSFNLFTRTCAPVALPEINKCNVNKCSLTFDSTELNPIGSDSEVPNHRYSIHSIVYESHYISRCVSDLPEEGESHSSFVQHRARRFILERGTRNNGGFFNRFICSVNYRHSSGCY